MKLLQFLISLLLLLTSYQFLVTPTFAITDPLSTPNNKFGIHIISPTPEEASSAADLVNSTNGDWGYVTILIERNDRNPQKWQEFFDLLRRKHLIPIVRIATSPDGDNWKRPDQEEEEAWAEFLDSLAWPVQNRYVIIYNEPNHGREWGGTTDPADYAITLEATIDALKSTNEDFFVLNGGFDSSAPQKIPAYQDQVDFMQKMQNEVPGIFEKLDGWVSHSYPNPGFTGSPNASGRGTIRNYQWELNLLQNLGVKKTFPVFITETGWKHAEGLSYDRSLPTAQVTANYYKQAFLSTFSNQQIVAVTPFLLNYQDSAFDHFSFRKVAKDNPGIEYYPQFEAIKTLPKSAGKPKQEYKAELVRGEIFRSLVTGENYDVFLTFKNAGQAIWNDSTTDQVKLIAIQGGKDLGIKASPLPSTVKIEPGKDFSFLLSFKAPESGIYKVMLNLVTGGNQFDSNPFVFNTEIKEPVTLKISAKLKWKNNFAGDYILKITGAINKTVDVLLGVNGASKEIESRYLIPDYPFSLTLSKPYYKDKTVTTTVHSGLNELNFGELQPDLFSSILKPDQFWKLLPFSN